MPRRAMGPKVEGSPTTADVLTLPACFITLRSEPAANNDQLEGIRFSTFWCCIYNYIKYMQQIFHQQVSVTMHHITNKQSGHFNNMVCVFNTIINRLCQSRQTENTSLPTLQTYLVQKAWLDNLWLSLNCLVFCNRCTCIFQFINWPLHSLYWYIFVN